MNTNCHTGVRSVYVYPPKTFKKGRNFNEHLRKLEVYFQAHKVAQEEKATILLTSLEDDIQYELFSFAEYDLLGECDYKELVKLLDKLLNPKISEVSPIVEILNIRQEKGQSLKDFVSSLRIKCFELFGHKKSLEEREKIMIKAFLNGLQNKHVAMALKELKPSSLEQCYEMIKFESNDKIEENIGDFNVIKTNPLEQQIKLLQNQITHLTAVVRGLADKLNDANPHQKEAKWENTAQKYNTTNKLFMCYRCGKKDGHKANECTNAAFCSWCKREGHSFRDCLKRKRKPNINRMFEADDSSLDGSLVNTPDSVDDHNNTEADFCLIKSRKRRPEKITKRILQESAVERNVMEWANYVSGEGKRPKKILVDNYSVITKSRPELAKNKPLISCSVENETTKALADSGCEINVIHKPLVDKILSKSPTLRRNYKKASSFLRCANDSRIEVVGRIELPIELATNKKIWTEFVIVKDILPRIILGIKFMKRHDMRIMPSKECVYLQGLRIPFESKIENENLNTLELVPRAKN